MQIGALKAGGRIDDLSALDGGYFGWGRTDFPEVWYSADGRDWTRTELAKPVRPCPGWIDRPDGEVLASASNGDEVVLVGLEYAPEAAQCGTWRAAAWVSPDGKAWQRAPGFGKAGVGSVWSEDVWATPEGWEAAVKGGGEVTIWQSADGLTWTSAATVAHGDTSVGPHAVDSSGARLLVIYDYATESSRLLISHDGRDWRDATGPPSTGGGVARILAPAPGTSPWLVVTTDENTETSTIWTSTDLEHWESAPFPMPTVESIAHTTYGLLALGIDPCRDTGGPCPTDPPQYFLSHDGLAWTPLDAAVDAEVFLDSGAGVLGMGRIPSEGDAQPIWRLEPYSADEASLFTGLRPDARFACAPRRVDLPARAVAGVECSPQVDGIDRIGAYRFADEEDLLDTYFKRLADNGVKPRSGSCPQRAGENAYQPGDDGATVGPARYGCYLNEFGIANYRFTDPAYLVYVGILGTGTNLKRLHDWAWRDNQDVPGSPTVWRGNAYGQ